ncbi:MAG: N-acetyl-alpha-D-glucosaminyl L-malate synthase BshA [Myxococcota bacterium]
MSALRIGIVCYPTLGGSGVIAAEVGLALAGRGHHVHFVGAGLPSRLTEPLPPRVRFHPVPVRDYPVFPSVPYGMALASALVAVAEREGLDLVHAHYAVPHAASAWMAREVLAERGAPPPALVTTLHGTDITLVGADEAYLPITRHALLHSDAVTAVSAWLRDETRAQLDLPDLAVEVIPNFVDTARFRPRPRTGPPVLLHASNQRPVKRLAAVVDVFARVAVQRDVQLVVLGDGPDRPAAEAALARRDLADRVRWVGERADPAPILADADVFLLPSATESFGLVALEALACGVPVVASAVGGLPEVVPEGAGFLVPPDDLDQMAARVLALLDDPALHARFAAAGRAHAERFAPDAAVDRYEALYRSLVAGR